MERAISLPIDSFNSYTVENQCNHSCIVQSLPHGGKSNILCLSVDPSIQSVKAQYKDGRPNSHDKSKVGVLGIVISSLGDG